MMSRAKPHVVVFSTLFPAASQPQAGLFIRERMFRVAGFLPITIVSPTPWFPFQSLLRLWRPNFRPPVPLHEVQSGIKVHRPRFLSFPGGFKRFDGFFLALGALKTVLALKREGSLDILDAHFAYPDGYAATLLGRWIGVPATITLRGSEARQIRSMPLRHRISAALRSAERIFAVSDSLKRLAISLGIAHAKVSVLPNGVDVHKFRPVDKAGARAHLRLAEDALVLVSVGGLVERKGFHRVIECLPQLRQRFPKLQYLIVGGASAEGDISESLRAQVHALDLQEVVKFLGPVAPSELSVPLSAADIFVLATRNEGWANVFLEAMACGLPIVTTDVGGNREVVCRPELGTVVPFDNSDALIGALAEALERSWDREAIIAHARNHDWSACIPGLVQEFERIHDRAPLLPADMVSGHTR